MSIRDVSVYNGPDYDNSYGSTIFAGDGKGTEYTSWDKYTMMVCNCDNSYFGADCSSQMCPKGDDPVTVNQKIELSI